MLIAKWKKQGYEKVSAMIVRIQYPYKNGLLTFFPPTALLPALHPDQGDQLQQHVHLPRAQRAAEAGSGNRMRQLWMQRLFE